MSEACRVVWDSDLKAGTKTMHWLGALDAPRCGLERYAKDVFDFHTKGVRYDPNTSGAVWWVQIRELHGVHGAAGAGIHWHWDLDHQGRAQGIPRRLWTPAIATVTYLSNGGAPTAMLHDEYMSLSAPRMGCHLAFRGDLLHGAPQELNTTFTAYERITLLVNIWLDHHPGGLVPLPPEMASEMGKGSSDDWCNFSPEQSSQIGVRSMQRSDTRWHPPLIRDLTVGGSMQLKVSFPDPNNLWGESEESLLRIEVPDGDGVTHHANSSNRAYAPL